MNSKKVFIILLISLAIFFIIILKFKSSSSNPEVCINNKCFKVELAKTQEERAKGLMYRNSLDKNMGALFIFPSENIYTFWMKNTLIPLDIIWISKDNKIVYIAENVPPCLEDSCKTYSPEQKALYVLEINAGESEKYNFKEGNKVNILKISLQ